MENFNFENALKRITEITHLLEKGEISLDEMVKLYTEGTKLAAECSKVINDAQTKITRLMENETDD